jgi:MFS family permease
LARTVLLMTAIATTPGARRLIALSIIARLPLTMVSIGLLLHAKHLTGSFAAAGAVDAAYAISLGLGAPLVGRAVDRRGQTAVLLVSSVAAAAMLAVVAALPVGTSLPALIVPACAIGCAMPPVGACLRALVPGLMPDAAAARAFYAIDATAVELTWITGPALAVTLGAAFSTGFALTVAAAVSTAGTAAFAAHPASRGWRPAATASPERSRPGRSPGLRTLILVMGPLGVVFSAVQVGVAAATAELGASGAAGPLLAVWGAGSLLGGLIATRTGGGARSAAGVSLLLGALTIGHLSLAVVATSTLGMAAVLLLAGATIAPTEASLYAIVDDVVPAGTLTESFSWLATAAAVGAALGAAAGGSLAASAGPVSAFALAGAAGVVAVMTSTLRGKTLPSAPAIPAYVIPGSA